MNRVATLPAVETWSYSEAFSRNLGLVTPSEQERLRQSRVAVAGLGGVGGVDLVTLARLGIGKFTIADPDVFEVKNSNRQYGAKASTRGLAKAEVMRQVVLDINPEADVRLFAEPLGRDNIDAFLEGAAVLIDGIDAFAVDVRRLLFAAARRRGVYALGAGPIGFSTAWVVFSPHGMSFERYFDLNDAMSDVEKFVAYVIGMCPAATQRAYMDLSHLDVARQTGPSLGLACQLASGVVAAEVAKILLGRGNLRVAPCYQQFDAYTCSLKKGRLLGGNRNPLQRLKRRWLLRYLRNNAPLTANPEA
jgi:molybdopterin/thiamine biosynthesis adenylyltransferase